jgi:hypothetical protein
MNWKGCGRKRSWLILRYHPGIRLDGLRKTMTKISSDSRFPERDMNPGPPEYEAGVLTNRPRRSVKERWTTLVQSTYKSQHTNH